MIGQAARQLAARVLINFIGAGVGWRLLLGNFSIWNVIILPFASCNCMLATNEALHGLAVSN